MCGGVPHWYHDMALMLIAALMGALFVAWLHERRRW